jgi:hypothetical protein
MRRTGIDLHAESAYNQATYRHRPVAEPVPLPQSAGAPPFRMTSQELGLPSPPGGCRVFHLCGDTGGIDNPKPQDAVVAALIADLDQNPEVAFLWHVGDMAYYEGERAAFDTQLFEAYVNYDRLILGHPGNHDAEGPEGLTSFMRYFCDTHPRLLPEVEEYGRDTVDLPNVYWTLRDDFMTIIALFSNVPSGGVIDAEQAAWLAGELKAAPPDRPLVVSLHHPPYSVDAMHGGSAEMIEVLDGAFSVADRAPELVVAGHVHDEQFFTRERDGKEIAYVVSGNGGYRNLHPLADDAEEGREVAPGVTFEYGDASEWGFLRLSADVGGISGEYVGVSEDGTVTPGKHAFSMLMQ